MRIDEWSWIVRTLSKKSTARAASRYPDLLYWAVRAKAPVGLHAPGGTDARLGSGTGLGFRAAFCRRSMRSPAWPCQLRSGPPLGFLPGCKRCRIPPPNLSLKATPIHWHLDIDAFGTHMLGT